MQVNNVRVSFQRKKQPASYEEAAPAVEFAATLDDGEDHVAAAVGLLTEAQTIVYAGLGYGLPDKVSEALAAVSGNKPALVSGNIVAKTVVESAPETDKPAEEPAETPEEPAAEPVKRGRGRPKGSKNTAPKKGTKAAEEQAAAGVADTAAKTAADDGLPPEDTEDETDRQISASPEDRQNPDDDLPPDDDAGTPTEAPSGGADAEFTAKDLHKMITDAYSAKKLSLANAKSVLAHFRVARAQDLTAEQALEGKTMVEKMLAVSGS
jgi:hypothetical protein